MQAKTPYLPANYPPQTVRLPFCLQYKLYRFRMSLLKRFILELLYLVRINHLIFKNVN